MIESHKFTTKNGLKVLLVKRSEKYTAGISFLINAGSIYENEENSGISHFFEHLFFGGTKSYPTEEILKERFQEIGFSPGARTVQDMIEVYGAFPKSEAKESLEILCQMVFESLLESDLIEKERQVILSEIRMRKDDNFTYLWDEHGKIRFKKGSSLQLPIGGTEESVSKISSKDIKDFYKKFCTPKNSLLVLGSSLEFKDSEKIIRNVFEKIPAGNSIELETHTNKEMSGAVISSIERDTDHVYLLISFPSNLTSDIRENWKILFLNTLLSQQFDKELRIKKGLVYGIGASESGISKGTGMSYVQTSFALRDFEEVIKSIFSEIEKLKKGIIDEKTLNRIRTTGNRTLPMNFDSLSGAMSWVIGSYFYEGIIHTPEETIDARNAVTLKHIQQTANEVYDFKKINVVGLGPIKEEGFKKEIIKFLVI